MNAWMQLLVLCCGLVQTPVPQEVRRDLERRIAWWNEARFGMFIHWGLYAVPAGRWNGKDVDGIGEWIQNSAQIKVADYEPLQKQFNPVKFDAKEWAAIANDAGMKYVVITSKHHDGFCLWDSQFTDWDVMGTPFHRDILKELSEAVRGAGLQMCFYHSIMDWHHPDYLPRREFDPRPEVKADFPRYVQHLKDQLGELVSRYGPLGVLWFDGEWESTWTHDLGRDLYEHVRKLQPSILVNNRVDKGRDGMAGLTAEGDFRGDFGTPEQEVPSTGIPGMFWESCMTMNDTWGYKASDKNWKSATQLVQILCETASKGGNFLLNVGPTAEGLIPPESVERLREIGKWMHVNSECIYGTSAGPFPKLAWGRCTQKPGRLYLQVFDWPKNGELTVPGLKNEVTKAWLLADASSKLALRHAEDGWRVTTPAAAPTPHASVIVLEIEGPPLVEEMPIAAAADGSVRLQAIDAVIHGATARYESRDDRRCIGYWSSREDWVSWRFRTNAAAKYTLRVTQACDPAAGGGRYVIEVAGKELSAAVQATASWGDFVTVDLGPVDLPVATLELALRPRTLDHQALFNLRSIELLPVK